MVEIESQIVDFTAGIKTLLEQTEMKRQLQADQEKQSNQEKMNQIQVAIHQMSQILIQKGPREKMNDKSSKNSIASNKKQK